MENYSIVREIGRGNYGKISLVQDNRDGRTYVAKRIPLTGKTPQQRQTAENEVRVMARLDHPNIVGFQQAFIQNDTLHILMEFADGIDVEKLLIQCLQSRRMLPEDRILDIFVPTVLAVRHIHKQHLLHRDLKSANIFLTQNGDVRLGDFGFSKQLTMTSGLATTICGTPYYFSPEMCQKLPYNNKSDCWALGVVLYEMINLRKPFEAQNLPELKKRVLTEEPAPFVATHISPELKELCLSLLQKLSSTRPSVETILQFPIIRKHLQKLSANIEKRREAASRRGEDIRKAHPKQSAAAPPSGGAFSTTQQQQQDGHNNNNNIMNQLISKMNRDQYQQYSKTGLLPPELQQQMLQLQQQQGASATGASQQSLHSRKLPEIASQLGTNTAKQVMAELASAVDEERRCQTLKQDVDALLNSPVPAVEDVFEAIGEAQSDDEKMLRHELGDSVFVRVIEILLTMSVTKVDTEKKSLEAELTSLLGEKTHLLDQLQAMSLQFGLEE